MNETATLSPDPPPQPNKDLRELQLECLMLRKLLLVTVVFLLISSGSINLYLLRQMISARKDVAVLRPRVAEMVAAYQRNEEPFIKGFLNSLVGFSKTHPDFQPILARYNVLPTPAAVSSAPRVPPVVTGK